MLLSYGGRRLLLRSIFRRDFQDLKFFMTTDSAASRENVPHIAEPEGSKLLKVAVIGVPNAGKSTLINRLMSIGVCPVSSKAHTTRATQNAIMLENEIQLVLADTPGVVSKKETKKFSIPEEFAIAPEDSARKADIIAVLHSIENKILRDKLDPKVIGVLQKFPTKPAILIINKIDKIKGKQKLLNTVFHLCDGLVAGKPIPVAKQKRKPKELSMDVLFRKTKIKMSLAESEQSDNKPFDQSGDDSKSDPLVSTKIKYDENGRVVRGWPNFQEVFLISALEGNGVENLKNYLKTSARTSPWAFNGDILTDCPPADLTLRIVKSKMLEYLKDEIPYMLEPKIEYWDTNNRGVLRIVIGIKVHREKVISMFFTRKRHQIIKEESEKQLSELLRVPIDLYLNIVLAPQNK